ncbi:MAG: dihydrofolate reductase, partial [Fusobacteriaceae bacterium]
QLLKDYKNTGKDVFICGGATIYRYFLENYPIDEILVSHLKSHVKVEKANEPLYFPNVENYGYSPKEILEYEDFFVYIYIKN